ncbi:hypothetical protein SSAG_01205 [Streptomyces sp. Mg1]|nr:hypothetical protein SSAG_01205 [Streptomyces sp. Mg1]
MRIAVPGRAASSAEALLVHPGQAGDAPALTQVMAAILVERLPGRPWTRPAIVLGDKVYSSWVAGLGPVASIALCGSRPLR